MRSNSVAKVLKAIKNHRLKSSAIVGGLTGLTLLAISGCSTTPPSNPENLCSIFQEKDSWYVAAHEVHAKWGIPIHVAMAIMAQESSFSETAKPPMRYFLFIPYGRGSSAYGYAQATDGVWQDYVAEQGSWLSDREDFADSLDFIAWYMTRTKRNNQINFSDAYNQYLNYHEGWQGFAQHSYQGKEWLLEAAKKVEKRSENYRKQLLNCNLY